MSEITMSIFDEIDVDVRMEELIVPSSDEVREYIQHTMDAYFNAMADRRFDDAVRFAGEAEELLGQLELAVALED